MSTSNEDVARVIDPVWAKAKVGEITDYDAAIEEAFGAQLLNDIRKGMKKIRKKFAETPLDEEASAKRAADELDKQMVNLYQVFSFPQLNYESIQLKLISQVRLLTNIGYQLTTEFGVPCGLFKMSTDPMNLTDETICDFMDMTQGKRAVILFKDHLYYVGAQSYDVKKVVQTPTNKEAWEQLKLRIGDSYKAPDETELKLIIEVTIRLIIEAIDPKLLENSAPTATISQPATSSSTSTSTNNEPPKIYTSPAPSLSSNPKPRFFKPPCLHTQPQLNEMMLMIARGEVDTSSKDRLVDYIDKHSDWTWESYANTPQSPGS